ncbi:HAD hydrolase-like protein, partial [Candidatus Micrarchaeota archaeon]|nr:HAD hydrolase-like protein [Candidatus Micrarchaeota archaeon]
ELALIGSDPKYYVEKGKQMNEEIRKNAENVAKAVLAGAYPLCTSRDKVIMTTNGNMLGPGIVVNEAEQNLASAGSTIRFNCAGKPSADIFKLIMKRLGTEPHQTLIIGDQIDMDIVGANNSLCKSILILSDKEQVPELKKCMNDNKTDCLPDFVFQSAEELARSI